MTDITRKLEVLANLKPGEIIPPELGDGNWALVISGICADALAEIQRLRLGLAHSNALRCVSQPVWPTGLPSAQAIDWKPMEIDFTLVLGSEPEPAGLIKRSGNTATQVIVDPHPAPRSYQRVAKAGTFIAVETHGKPIAEVVDPYGEPWGSPYAMNPENWK